ncbi:hypothetical protein DRQ20_00400 [bacterium]|nr:MAG: hypothetical protein DRQ20_00400 [bacterium]
MPDAIIIGGGIIGGASLYYLLEEGYDGKVLVLEKRDALAQDATSLSAGGFRNLWSTKVNMKLTTWSIERFKNFQDEIGVAIGYEPIGYLFTYYSEPWKKVREFIPVWNENGVRAEEVKPEDIERFVPGFRPGLDHLDPDIVEFLGIEEIAGAVFGPDCGAFNPTSVATGYFERSKERYPEKVEIRLKSEVEKIVIENGRAKGIVITSGEKIESEMVILAAGAYSRDILVRSGIPDEENIPVYPVRRMLFIVNPPPIDGFMNIPMTIIDNGVYFRPEAGNLLVGRANPDEPVGYNYDADKNYYLDEMNPYMQARIPGMEYCRIQSMWGGLYAVNMWDHNAIISPHISIENLFIVTGFSGHGAMEAPAAGKSIAEIILKGEPETIPEVKELSMSRIKEGKRVKETIVI